MSRSSAPLTEFRVDTTGLTAFQRAVRKADPVLAKALRDRLKAVGATVAAKAKANASWSKRIPPTVRASATTKGVAVKAGGASAPHARVYEHRGQPGTVRHPVFGDRNVWTDKNTPARPFLSPAAQAARPQTEQAAAAAVEDWARSIGSGS